MKIVGNKMLIDKVLKAASKDSLLKSAFDFYPEEEFTLALQSIVKEIDTTVMSAAKSNKIGIIELHNLMKSVDKKFRTNINETIVRAIKPIAIQEVVRQINANIAKISTANGKNSTETTNAIIELAKEIDKNFGTKLVQSIGLKMPKSRTAPGGPAPGAPKPGAPATGAPAPGGGLEFGGHPIGNW
jgi:hypothetical protein